MTWVNLILKYRWLHVFFLYNEISNILEQGVPNQGVRGSFLNSDILARFVWLRGGPGVAQ